MSQVYRCQNEGRKLVSAKHRDLHAAAEVYDVLDALPELERRRVIQWVNEKYSSPPLANPKKE